MSTYFTSDWHLGHKNLITNLTTWDNTDNTRSNFNSVKEHDEHIISQTNAVVAPEDTLYILGDVSFHRNFRKTIALLCEIKCRNLHYIWGNHDYKLRKEEDFLALFNSYSAYKEVTVAGQYIVLSHYPFRTWNRAHRGSYMLYGHCHSALDNINAQEESQYSVNSYYSNLKTMDVGIDNAFRLFGNYRPFSLKDIQSILAHRSNNTIDQI